MLLTALLLALATKSIATRPVPQGDAGRWFTPADYPVDALLAREQGVVGFELMLDAAGKPLNCHVYRSSGHTLLDGATCRLAMERGRFTPARQRARKRGKRGKVILVSGPTQPSVFRRAVRWRLPNKGGVSDQTFVVHTQVAPGGVVGACTITGPGALGGNSSCGLFGSKAFLSQRIGKDWPRTATTEVRLDLSFAGADTAKRARTPDAYWLLGEASVRFGADGRMTRCVGLKALTSAANKNTDLCEILRLQPPRVAPAMANRPAIYALDLSAYFR